MSATDQQLLPSGNAEAIEAWDGPLFDRFVQYRHIVVGGLSRYGEEAMRLHPPPAGGRALDIGCGFGDTSTQLANLIGADGSVLGLDAAPRFIEAARSEALESGARNLRFEVADIETAMLPGPFDLAFSRFGTMFFANPVVALRNVRRALRPGGRLIMVVWRAKVENEWLYRPQTITERFVTKPEDYDAPTCGPGPFSMANADTVSGILTSAGFDAVTLRRCDLPIMIGHDINEAVEFAMSLGPAGEILRLAGDRATHLHEPVADALRAGLADWARPEGVIAPSSTWIITAATPENGSPVLEGSAFPNPPDPESLQRA
jgi:SAM-dependent methyltransferase